MRLVLTVPAGTLVDENVARIDTETNLGALTLLERHADTVLLLVPGLLSFRRHEEPDIYLAVDHGVLVKAGAEVRVACQRALIAGDLGQAAAAVRDRFVRRSEEEKRARTALYRLEAEILRRVGELRR